MQLSDDGNILDNGQKKLLLDMVNGRLVAKSLAGRVSLLRVIPISYPETPSSMFEDEKKTVIMLYISPQHFSKPNIRFIILHEIQHRIDELSLSFGYDVNKKQQLKQNYGECFRTVLAHLWDIYINGRLDREGLFETDTTETIGVGGRLCKRDRLNDRRLGIEFLEKCGVSPAEQIYDEVWSAREGEFNYDHLAQLALHHMSYL